MSVEHTHLDWLWSGSVQVQAVFSEPAPEHWGSVQPVIEPEPAHKGSGSCRFGLGEHQGAPRFKNRNNIFKYNIKCQTSAARLNSKSGSISIHASFIAESCPYGMHLRAFVKHQTFLLPFDDDEHHLSELTLKMTVLQDKLMQGWADNLMLWGGL